LSGTYTLFIPPTAISIAFWGVKSGSGLINTNALFGSERLGVYSKMVANSMRNKLLGLLGNKVCTYSDLDELVKRFGKESDYRVLQAEHCCMQRRVKRVWSWRRREND